MAKIIKVTRLLNIDVRGVVTQLDEYYFNADIIFSLHSEKINATTDATKVVTNYSNYSFIVRESIEEIIQLIEK